MNAAAAIRRYAKFLLSTLGGTVVDTLVLWVLAHQVFRGWYVGENLISPTISFECAVFTNYTLAYFFVWPDRMGEFRWHPFLHRFLGYNASCIAGFLIKMAGLLFFKWLTDWDVVICNLLALFFSGAFNYLMNEFVIFRSGTSHHE